MLYAEMLFRSLSCSQMTLYYCNHAFIFLELNEDKTGDLNESIK
jgi:hypothetical protein